MNICARVFCFLVSLILGLSAQSSSAQIYYIPFELPSHPNVNPYALGWNLAASEDRIYVSTIGTQDSSNPIPAAVHEYNRNTYNYIRTFHPQDDPLLDFFGGSIDYHNGKLLIGASGADNVSGNGGQAYLFDLDTGLIDHTYIESFTSRFGGDFGSEVNRGDIATFISGRGVSIEDRVFVYNNATNGLLLTLFPDPTSGDLNYGTIIDHNEDYLAISAPGTRFEGVPGAVYVYDFVTGALLYRITAPFPDPSGVSQFGNTMDLEGNKLLIGSGDFANIDLNGKVFVYDLTTGDLDATLTRVGGSFGDWFGVTSISAEGNLAVIGAQNDSDVGFRKGAVYVFDLDTYELIDKVHPPMPLSRHRVFGRDVKIENGTIITTTFLENAGLNEKAIHVLEAFCRADINLDGATDFFDISAFVKFGIDFNNDGVFDFFDVSEFLTSYQTPCP